MLGVGVAAYLYRRRERQWLRERLDIETKLRRIVVPVLERRAGALGIPVSARGKNADGPVSLTMTLASAIRSAEESVELPFGDTVEVARSDLDEETPAAGVEKTQ